MPKVTLAFCVGALFFVTSCQSLKRADLKDSQNQTINQKEAGESASDGLKEDTESSAASSEKEGSADQVPSSEATPLLPPKRWHRVGLILGAGGAKTYAILPVLKEIQRSKIPVVAIGGLEFGALTAALYSVQGSSSEADWQLMKLDAEDFEDIPVDMRSMQKFLGEILVRASTENARIPFACVAHNYKKNQFYLMSRGPMKSLLPYCLPYPPLMKPFNHNVAGIKEIKRLSDFLRSKGADFIVFINALGAPAQSHWQGTENSESNLMWQEYLSELQKTSLGLDWIIHIETPEFKLGDFELKREIQLKGADQASEAIEKLRKNLNL